MSIDVRIAAQERVVAEAEQELRESRAYLEDLRGRKHFDLSYARLADIAENGRVASSSSSLRKDGTAAEYVINVEMPNGGRVKVHYQGSQA